jgi:hypothetical protein
MLRAVREDERAAAAYGRKVFFAKYRAYLFGAALAGLAGGLFAIFISAFNPSAWTPQELLVVYAAILVGGRGNPRGVIAGVFVVYAGFIELTRYLPSPASRPEFGPAMRQVLIGLLIILMLRFRPEGIFRERPGIDGRTGLTERLGRLRARGAAAAGSQPAGTAVAATGTGAQAGPAPPARGADGLPARAAGGAAREGQAGESGGPG